MYMSVADMYALRGTVLALTFRLKKLLLPSFLFGILAVMMISEEVPMSERR